MPAPLKGDSLQSEDDGVTFTVTSSEDSPPHFDEGIIQDSCGDDTCIPTTDEEDRVSSGTYSLPKASSNGIRSGPQSLPTTRTAPNGCPVHGRGRHVRAASTGNSSSWSSESQLLNCGVCAKAFKNPKVLPCLHTFCEDCLLVYTPPESLTLTCPVCRQQSILPKDGVAGLQSNTWVKEVMESFDTTTLSCSKCHSQNSSKQCQDCQVALCSACACRHQQEPSGEFHSVISVSAPEGAPKTDSFASCGDTTFYCPSHQGQTLRFYCRTCETAICSSCTDIEHRSHATLRLNEAVDEHKDVLQDLVNKVTMQLPSVKEAICDISDVVLTLEEERRQAEDQVRRCFRDLTDALTKRQTELLNRINSAASLKQKVLEEQREELREWMGGVESGCEFVEKALVDSHAMEVVLVRKQLGEKLSEYADMSAPPAPRENPHLKFVVGNVDPLKTAISHIGAIQSTNAVPHQSCATGDALRQVTLGRQSVVTVVTKDHAGEKTQTGGADLTATLSPVSRTPSPRRDSKASVNGKVSPQSRGSRCSVHSAPFETSVLDLNNGTYEVAFRIHHEGQYDLALKLYGQHLAGSPFRLTAAALDGTDYSNHASSLNRRISASSQVNSSYASRPPSLRPHSHRSSCSRTNPIEDDLIMKIGRRGRNKGEFGNPQGICYSPIKEGRLAVADSNNQCIQVFSLSGESKIKFGVRGRSAGQLQRPTGVASLPNGNYVVADYENKWVSIFEPNGRFVTRLGHGKLLGPKGLCIDHNGHIIVVDNKGSSVCVFQQTGKLLTRFGNRNDQFQFAGPHFAAVNSRGEIAVTDFHNHCVKVFDQDGEFIFTFGTNGEGNGQFNAPTGVAVDSNDNIIVADWGNSRIQVFDSQGSFLSYVNTAADPLYGPQGLALTADGNIVVADSGNHCIKMYKYLQ